MDLNKVLLEVEKTILEAGTLLDTFWEKRENLRIENKEGQGLVSLADKEVEKFLIQKLKLIIPSAKFCAEESSFDNPKNKDEFLEGYSWMIDPLDGTNNFLSGFDYFSISIALCSDAKPILAAVYRPRRGDLFLAIKGQGAFVQNQKSNIAKRKIDNIYRSKSLKQSLLCTGFAGEKGISFDREFDVFKNVMMKSRGVRRLGSAALDLCYLASGSWNGFWEKGLAPWDTSAGALICQESGVQVSNIKGEPYCPFDKTIVVCPEDIKQELLSILNQ